MIVKHQMRVDKLIVADSSDTSDEESKDKPISSKQKLEEPVLDDLVKGIQELNLNLKAIKLEGLGSKGSTSNRGCGMKKLAEEIQHNVALVDAATYGLQVYSKVDVEDKQAYGDLWPYALKTAGRGKVPQGKLSEAGNSICETTGWSADPVDSLSVYACIAKLEANEAMVEEKRKRDEETLGTTKRATKASSRKEEGIPPKPTPKVDKKQGKPRGPSYKLKLDIEVATDLKKVFEERILNSKVEMTPGDILGIAKHEFHEAIIDIIKKKRQIPSDHEP
ncbi:hypothetical protein L7F22_040272 [Adiantum nelumboides]|nr:hypothetical protein [Adiantum nelumboides]